jgi:hypothetical protein
MKCVFLLGLLFLLLTGSTSSVFSVAQVSPLHKQIEETYNFHPRAMSHEQRTEKSALLDKFWALAKAQPSVYIPALRLELGDFNNPPFFLFDGSMLLLSLSHEQADRKIAIVAMAHCDLRDLQDTDYFRQVHNLSIANEDTTAAALHILERPDFKVVVPQHALTLAQDYSLVYLLLPIDQAYWLQPAIERLKTENDRTAQKSLLLLLWYAQTDTADRAIAAFAAAAANPPVSRAYARELIHRNEQVRSSQHKTASASDDEGLKRKRRERLKAVSDEALIDLDEYTAQIIAGRK